MGVACPSSCASRLKKSWWSFGAVGMDGMEIIGKTDLETPYMAIGQIH
jgi:hypothetical protein